MSWVGSEKVHAFWGARSAAVRWPGQAAQWVETSGLSESWVALLEMLAARRKADVSLALSAALARPFVLRPMEGMTNWTDALTVAEALAPAETGLREPSTVWLDRWQQGRPCLAIGADAAVADQLEALTLSRPALRLVEVTPWWGRAIQRWDDVASGASLIAIDDGDALTLLHRMAGVWISATAYASTPTGEQAQALLRRAVVQADSSALQVWHASLVKPHFGEPGQAAVGLSPGGEVKWERSP